MPIWKKEISTEQLNKYSVNTLAEHVGIKVTEIGDDYVKGTMPVDNRTKQPMGILHGGASVVLAETLGSMAGNYAVGEKQACVGLDINANHISKAQSGLVTGIAKPLHLGRATQVWEIKLYSDSDKLTCVSRLTLAVIDIA